MLDPYARRVLRGPLDRLAASVDVRGISSTGSPPSGCCWASAAPGPPQPRCGCRPLCCGSAPEWPTGWTVRWPGAGRSESGADPSPAGGFLDIVSDFAVYGASVAGVGIGVGGSSWPFLAVLGAYYLNGTAFLAFSSLAERTGRTLDDGRSLSFVGDSPRALRRSSCTRSGCCSRRRRTGRGGLGRDGRSERGTADLGGLSAAAVAPRAGVDRSRGPASASATLPTGR